MIEKWAIRENNVSDNSVYILVLKGTDDDARAVERNLAGFAALISAEVPQYTHVLELSNITDDDMLEKIRVRIEKIISETGESKEHFTADSGREAVLSAGPAEPQKAPAQDLYEPADTKILRPAAQGGDDAEKEDILNIINSKNRKPEGRDSTASLVLANSDLSLKKSYEGNLNVDIKLDNDIDVGDGTLIHLGAAETKEIKDMSGYNGKFFKADIKPLDQHAPQQPAQKAKPVIMPLAPDIGPAAEPAKSASAEIVAPAIPALAREAAADAPDAPAPKKGGLFGRLLGKISSAGKEISARKDSFLKKAPPVSAPAPQPQPQQAAPVPAPQQVAPAASVPVPDAPAEAAPQQQEHGVKPAGGGLPNPQGRKVNAQEAVKRHSIIVGGGEASEAIKSMHKKSAHMTGKQAHPPARPMAEDIFSALPQQQGGGAGSLESKVELDDIFAAETILDFYSDTPAKTGATEQNVSQIIPTSPPARTPVPALAPAASPLPSAGDDLFDIPENLLGAAAPPPQKQQPAQPAALEAAKDENPAPAVLKPQENPAAVKPQEEQQPPSVQQSAQEEPPVKTGPQPVAAPAEPDAGKPDIQQAADVINLHGMVDLTQRQMPFGKLEEETKKGTPQEFNIHEMAAQANSINVGDIEETPPPRPAQPQEAARRPEPEKADKTNMPEPASEKIMIQEENPKEQNNINADPVPPAPAAPRQPAPPKSQAQVPPPPPKPAPPAGPAAVPAPPPPPAPVAPAAPFKPAHQPVRPAPRPAGIPVEEAAKAAAGTVSSIDHTIQVPAQTYKRSNWPLEIPLIPTFTFDSMDMASNRFSHANAMSVVENAGTVYNPFFIFGESGSGKTHFLHAMGYELSKKIPQEKLFITNGVRFARGIQRYAEEGRTAQLEEIFDLSEALIIDDIHLTAVNEYNREIISKVLNKFLQDKKQIIISSKYPPESLARFEELVNFRLEQGWVSELKPPRPQHFTRICNKMVEHSGLNISDAQAQSFFSGDNMSLGKISRDIRRVKVLHRRIADSDSTEKSYEELFAEMFATGGESESSEIIRKDIADITSLPRMESAEWGNFGFFFPQDQGDKFNWVAFAIMQKAKELGIKGGFHFALKSAYSTENIISSAFKIANICDNKNLKGAIILGPSLTVVPAPIRENFYDIVLHMLEVMLIRCGTIDAELIKNPSTYIKVLGDIIK